MLFVNRVLCNVIILALYINIGKAGITFFDLSSTIKVNPQATFNNQSNAFAGISGTLTFGPLSSVIGKPIVFNGGNLTDGNFTINLTGTFDPSMTSSIQLASPSRMNVTIPGKIPYKVQASGTNNSMEGLPSFQNPNSITFKSSADALTIAALNTLNKSPRLTSTINLGADLVLGDNVTVDGSGTVNFNNFNLITGKKDLVWTSTLLLSSASNLELSANSVITGRWTFDGTCHIEGNGYKLKLGPSGQILVRPNSSLFLNNIVIEGLKAGNIGCMDCTATLSFGNVLWKQDTNFTFTTGGLDVLGLWALLGTSTFTYSPCRTGRVVSRGTVHLGEDMTFLYAPPFSNRKMLTFDDASSTFALNASTLASTFTGMVLTKGTLSTQSHCYLTQNTEDSPALSESIQLGDGNPVNEMTIIVGPSSILDLLSGRLFYNQAE